jgi:hypothetical protein
LGNPEEWVSAGFIYLRNPFFLGGYFSFEIQHRKAQLGLGMELSGRGLLSICEALSSIPSSTKNKIKQKHNSEVLSWVSVPNHTCVASA